ncbi:MAG: LysR family transcriptional regulator [Alphaproteobacteria bacterium]
MDLNQIAIFAQVVESGSFTAAAAELRVPKTTVSRKVAALEADLGVRLLQRTTRSLAPTDAGQRYYDACSSGLAGIEAANRLALGEQEVPSGTIRVSSPAEDFFLSTAVAEFLTVHKHVRVEVILTDDRLDLIAERIDVAIRAGDLEDSSLIARKITSGSRIVCASPDYLAAAGTPDHPSDLADHTAVLHGRSLDHAVWQLESSDEAERVVVTGKLTANSLMFVLKACVAGVGLALLPSAIAAPEIAAGRLVHVLAAWATTPAGLHLVTPSNRYQSAAVRAFVAFIADRLTAATRHSATVLFAANA